MKTNIGLVAFVKKALAEKWAYVWGTYGKVLSETLLEQKSKQYPAEVGKYINFIRANSIGKNTADCIGLFKAYLWFDEITNKIVYNASTDYNANTAYQKAKVKGAIDTIPEIPGLGVYRMTGHIGVYIGNGLVIEARSTSRGVIMSPLKGTDSANWTHWLEFPNIEYIKTPITEPAVKNIILRVGSRGDEVKSLQENLIKLGYDLKADGVFGRITEFIVKQFQAANKLKQDGIVGPLTMEVIDRLIKEKEEMSKNTFITVRLGNKNETVKTLQAKLNEYGYKLVADGIFGAKTDIAVRDFQKKSNLIVDGIVGPKTWEKLLANGTQITIPSYKTYHEFMGYHGKRVYYIKCTKPEKVKVKFINDTLYPKYDGINGTFYDTPNPSKLESCWGLAVDDGKPIGPNAHITDWKGTKRGVIAWDGKKLHCTRINNYKEIPNMIWGVSGIMLLPNYDRYVEKYLSDVYRTTDHTIIGFNDANEVYLIKTYGSMAQLIATCRKLGLVGAVNLDGGGSSQINFDGKGFKSTRKVNNGVIIE